MTNFWWFSRGVHGGTVGTLVVLPSCTSRANVSILSSGYCLCYVTHVLLLSKWVSLHLWDCLLVYVFLLMLTVITSGFIDHDKAVAMIQDYFYLKWLQIWAEESRVESNSDNLVPESKLILSLSSTSVQSPNHWAPCPLLLFQGTWSDNPLLYTNKQQSQSSRYQEYNINSSYTDRMTVH